MKTVLIVGLGASGLACAHHLARRGWRIRAADTRTAPAGAATLKAAMQDVEIVTGGLPETLLDGVSLVVMSPGLSPFYGAAAPLVEKAEELGIEVVGEIECFARALKELNVSQGYAPVVIALTGTNGKTTTTTLVAKMAAESGRRTIAAGNIGPNAVTELDKAMDAGELPDVWVLELSSFQLATTTTLMPASAVVLNVTEDHLDWHGDMTAYADAKGRIYKPCTVRIANREDAETLRLANVAAGDRDVLTFGTDEPRKVGDYGLSEKDGTLWLSRFDEAQGVVLLMPEASLLIAGRHNATNALAALALIRAAGLPEAPALAALACYRGEPHRVERVLDFDGVTFIDDSKGTNVGAVAAAVKGFSAQGRRILIILGGDGKGQDFTPLATALTGNAGAVALIGRDAALIEAALASTGIPLMRHATLEAAVDWLWTKRRPGDVMLLSPACASWDMFRDYAERSARFIACAERIAAKEPTC